LETKIIPFLEGMADSRLKTTISEREYYFQEKGKSESEHNTTTNDWFGFKTYMNERPEYKIIYKPKITKAENSFNLSNSICTPSVDNFIAF
jgi:hypothetical protein